MSAMPSIDRALSGKGGGMVSAALSKQLIGVPPSVILEYVIGIARGAGHYKKGEATNGH